MSLFTTEHDFSIAVSIGCPLLQIKYAAIKDYFYPHTQVTFEVDYKMSLSTTERDIWIAVGVLSAVAVIYSCYLTQVQDRRSGRIGIDFVSLLELVFYLCASLSAVFFVVVLGFSVWWFALYKVTVEKI